MKNVLKVRVSNSVVTSLLLVKSSPVLPERPSAGQSLTGQNLG